MTFGIPPVQLLLGERAIRISTLSETNRGMPLRGEGWPGDTFPHLTGAERAVRAIHEGRGEGQPLPVPDLLHLAVPHRRAWVARLPQLGLHCLNRWGAAVATAQALPGL